MPYNGNGVFNRLFSWVADKAANINITASRMDADTNDIVSNGLGNALTRDGQGQPTADLSMNNFRHTHVANGVSRTDYAALGQVQDLTLSYAVLSGTDAYTGALVPPITAYATGADYGVSVPNPNTIAAPTINLGPGAVTVINMDGSALVAGSLNGQHLVRFDGTNLRVLNPAKAIGVGSSTLAMSAAINEASATLASAASVAIGAAPGNYIVITGSVAIISFDAVQSGTERCLKFSGTPLLTNSANLILPTGANITPTVGDIAVFRSEGGGIWRCTGYLRANGQALARPNQPTSQYLTSASVSPYTTPANCVRLEIEMKGPGGGGGAANTNDGTGGLGPTIFNGINANGGGAGKTSGNNSVGGAGGSNGTGSAFFRDPGIPGQTQNNVAGVAGGSGGGRGGGVSPATPGPGGAAVADSGAGGAGGFGGGGNGGGGGGGEGEIVRLIITNPAATYAFTIGLGGPGGAAGAAAGGAGANGYILVREYY